MDKLNGVLTDNASAKRLAVFLVGALAILLNQKFGLDLTETDKQMLAALVTAFILGSNYKEAALAKAEALGASAMVPITTTSEAITAIQGATQPPKQGGFASVRMLLLLVLIIAMPVFAQAQVAQDAPLYTTITQGTPAPANGCFLDDRACLATGKTVAELKAENDSLKQSIQDAPSPALFIAGGLVLGILAGALLGPVVLHR